MSRMADRVPSSGFLAGLILVGAAFVACTSTQQLDKADAMYESGDLEGALALYRSVAEADPPVGTVTVCGSFAVVRVEPAGSVTSTSTSPAGTVAE